jgi:hypothetical protein
LESRSTMWLCSLQFPVTYQIPVSDGCDTPGEVLRAQIVMCETVERMVVDRLTSVASHRARLRASLADTSSKLAPICPIPAPHAGQGERFHLILTSCIPRDVMCLISAYALPIMANERLLSVLLQATAPAPPVPTPPTTGKLIA